MQQKDRRELTPEEKWEQATLANNFIFYKVMRHHPDACKELLELAPQKRHPCRFCFSEILPRAKLAYFYRLFKPAHPCAN